MQGKNGLRSVGFFIVLFALFPDVSKAMEGVLVDPEASGIAEDSPTLELANIPISANRNWVDVCVDRSQNLNGDIQSINNFGTGQWSIGPAISSQLIIYDFGKEKAGVNQALGAGASFRFYRPITIKDEDGDPVLRDGTSKPWPKEDTVNQLKGELKKLKSASTKNEDAIAQKFTELKNAERTYNEELEAIEESRVYISQIKQECRQTTLGKNTTGYLAGPMFSITPTIFASEPINQDDLAIQPAILLGFFEDILNVGVGFNLTGPAGQKGNVFLLFGIGAGFNW